MEIKDLWTENNWRLSAQMLFKCRVWSFWKAWDRKYGYWWKSLQRFWL